MSHINIFAASVHGNASNIASEVAQHLRAVGHHVELFDPPVLTDLANNNADILLFVSSTTGQGELPDDMQTFVSACLDVMPMQTGKKYAVIGLGDSCFDDFCAAEKHLDQFASELGASKLGENLKIDASIDFEALPPALAWLDEWRQLIGS